MNDIASLYDVASDDEAAVLDELRRRAGHTHGPCYECGSPAAFAVDGHPAYRKDAPELRRCAVCAANAAADGEEITRLSDPETPH